MALAGLSDSPEVEDTGYLWGALDRQILGTSAPCLSPYTELPHPPLKVCDSQVRLDWGPFSEGRQMGPSGILCPAAAVYTRF